MVTRIFHYHQYNKIYLELVLYWFSLVRYFHVTNYQDIKNRGTCPYSKNFVFFC